MSDIKTAMILAAGRGTRMRAAQADPPKPLTPLTIGGRDQTLIDFILSEIMAAGIKRIVINLHHKAEQIIAHINAQTVIVENDVEIVFSPEQDILRETGGGVRHALPHLGAAPFLVCNADVIWQSHKPTLADFIKRFARLNYKNPNMAALLLLAARDTAIGVDNKKGDFSMDKECRLSRISGRISERSNGRISVRSNGRISERTNISGQNDYIFTGVQILTPALFDAIDEDVFSLNHIYDKAAKQGGLYGHRLDGRFLHIGTPEAWAEARVYAAQMR